MEALSYQSWPEAPALTDSNELVICHGGTTVSDFFQVRAFKSTSLLQTVKNVHVDGLADITVFWRAQTVVASLSATAGLYCCRSSTSNCWDITEAPKPICMAMYL